MTINFSIFDGLTAQWAGDVAAHFDVFAGDHPPKVEEVWVTEDLALHVRYLLGNHRLGARFRLDEDPTSGLAPTDSATLASNLLHNLPAVSEYEWVDDDGYCWWGDRPPTGWSAEVGVDRILTVRRRPGGSQ